jgi:uncharacterized protein YodC (DUF2158 family)
MKINTKFNIKDKVFIKSLKIWGRILCMYINSNGIEYNVRYFDGFNPKDCYFLEEELQINDGEEKIGFIK